MYRAAAETAVVLCKSCMCQYFVGSFVVAFQLQKFHHLECRQSSNFLTVFLDKLQSTVCISLPAFSCCKGCEFLYIFLNNKILITLMFQLEFLIQNTRHYMYSNL
jgi:hypothetical protein